MPTNFDRFALVRDVCEKAWETMQTTQRFTSPEAGNEARLAMTGRVMSAVIAGERNQERLLAIALMNEQT